MTAARAVLGTAIARADRRLRWYGIAYPLLVIAFTIGYFPLQPVAGFALAAVTAGLAVQLPKTLGTPAMAT